MYSRITDWALLSRLNASSKSGTASGFLPWEINASPSRCSQWPHPCAASGYPAQPHPASPRLLFSRMATRRCWASTVSGLIVRALRKLFSAAADPSPPPGDRPGRSAACWRIGQTRASFSLCSVPAAFHRRPPEPGRAVRGWTDRPAPPPRPPGQQQRALGVTALGQQADQGHTDRQPVGAARPRSSTA